MIEIELGSKQPTSLDARHLLYAFGFHHLKSVIHPAIFVSGDSICHIRAIIHFTELV